MLGARLNRSWLHSRRMALVCGMLGALVVAGVYTAGADGSPELESTGVPTATVLGAAVERIGSAGVRDRLEKSVLLADVTACGVVRQGTVTMLETSEGILGYTNAHVVRGADTVTLAGGGLGVGEGVVEHFLDGRDAAVVDPRRLSNPPREALDVAELPPVGSQVYTAGFPGGAWMVSSGRIVAIERRAGWGGDGPVAIVDVVAERGTSGGVVVDAQGRAVGLIAARDPRTGYTVAYPVADLFARAVRPAPSC